MIVLASASPRRRELLKQAGIAYIAMPADIEEAAAEGEGPTELTLRLAREKAEKIAGALGATPRRLVLGADTIVVLGDAVFGKPRDADDAFRLLRELSGRTHRVITGVAVVDTERRQTWERAVESRVTLRPASDAELRSYLATGESLDKAGAYAIQGEGRQLVSRLAGSETNVIGLPLEETIALLRQAGAKLGAES
jgi:septum formation protein